MTFEDMKKDIGHGYCTIDEWRKNSLKSRLKYFKDNRTKTAKSFGVTVRTLRNWINKFKKEIITVDD